VEHDGDALDGERTERICGQPAGGRAGRVDEARG
jgi:hypothetical protein